MRWPARRPGVRTSARAPAVFFAFLLAGACGKGPPPPPPPAPTVQVVGVLQRDVPVEHEWIASLDGFVNVDIKPQVTGYIWKQVYREGAFVRRGEVLFLIDPRNYKDAAAEARAALDRDLAALAKARLDVKRDRQLIAGEAIARQQIDNSLAAERQAAAAVEQARATLRQAQLNRGWTQVTSPIDGIVGIAQVQVGNLVNTSTTMTSVSQVDPIKAWFNIGEREYLDSAHGSRWAEPGGAVEPPLELVLQDGKVHPHHGTVLAVNRQFNAQTGTIALQGSFPNPGNVLRPGQHARVRAVITTRKDALLVPQRALADVQGKAQVGVVGADGKLQIRGVETSGQVGALSIVDHGVSAGEQVVVSDLTRLKPGMAVRAVPESGAAGASGTGSSAEGR